MSQPIRITVLVEDGPAPQDLMAEHGAAYWIVCGTRPLLFDTGQGPALEHNASALGISLGDAEAVILSHGHYDHAGGLARMLDGNRPVYGHPAALEAKFAQNDDGSARSIGMPKTNRAALTRKDVFCPVTAPTEIIPGVFATGPVPRVTPFEDASGPFFRDAGCTKPDMLTDDQSLFIPSPEGTIVVLGCAHAGVINTLEYVRGLTDGQPLAAVVGGMHLLSASKERIAATADALRALGVSLLSPCHCTGHCALEHFAALFRDSLRDCRPGSEFTFGRAEP